MKLKTKTLVENPQKYEGKTITITARLVPGLTIKVEATYGTKQEKTQKLTCGVLDLDKSHLLRFCYVFADSAWQEYSTSPRYEEVKASEGRDITLTGRFDDYSDSCCSTLFISRNIHPSHCIDAAFRSI
jgi:hypothetical protein